MKFNEKNKSDVRIEEKKSLKTTGGSSHKNFEFPALAKKYPFGKKDKRAYPKSITMMMGQMTFYPRKN